MNREQLETLRIASELLNLASVYAKNEQKSEELCEKMLKTAEKLDFIAENERKWSNFVKSIEENKKYGV